MALTVAHPWASASSCLYSLAAPVTTAGDHAHATNPLWRVGGPHLQSVAGIKKTGFGGTPPFLSLSTLLPSPRRGFLPASTQSAQPGRA